MTTPPKDKLVKITVLLVDDKLEYEYPHFKRISDIESQIGWHSAPKWYRLRLKRTVPSDKPFKHAKDVEGETLRAIEIKSSSEEGGCVIM